MRTAWLIGLTLATGVLLTFTAAASGSIWVADNARNPALRVDADGFAEVRWTDKQGLRRSLLIPPKGKVLPGGRLSKPNVARKSDAVTIPMERTLKQTPDGWFWALQAWRRTKNGPVQLRLSSWRGEPTQLTAATVCCRRGSETLQGRATFHGKPIFGRSPTPAGKKIRIRVFIDCLGCRGAGGWSRIIAVPTRQPNGSYSLWVRADWQAKKYRATLPGANKGKRRTPDARTIVRSSLP